MKKLFSLALLTMMMVAGNTLAQNTLVATLTHKGNIRMFYGTYALQQAHKAAVNGDVINLSGGGFQSVKITKALTIRGTGVLDALPTTIIGDFTISIPDSVTVRLNIEGCIISDEITVDNLSNAYFLKDNIGSITVSSKMVNGTFVNCYVDYFDLYGSSTVQFINCVVTDFYNMEEAKAAATFINCLVDYDAYDIEYLTYIQFVNCILWNYNNNSSSSLPPTSSAWNCVAVSNNDAFDEMSAQGKCRYAGTDIFVDGQVWKGLTDEAKAKYLGTDSTPVGQYGGMMPWSQVPSYPQITKMNVANKTTADGKLSVEIEVSAAE